MLTVPWAKMGGGLDAAGEADAAMLAPAAVVAGRAVAGDAGAPLPLLAAAALAEAEPVGTAGAIDVAATGLGAPEPGADEAAGDDPQALSRQIAASRLRATGRHLTSKILA